MNFGSWDLGFNFPFQFVPDSQTQIIMTLLTSLSLCHPYIESIYYPSTTTYSSFFSPSSRYSNRSFNLSANDFRRYRVVEEDFVLDSSIRFLTFFEQLIQMTIVDGKILSLIISVITIFVEFRSIWSDGNEKSPRYWRPIEIFSGTSWRLGIINLISYSTWFFQVNMTSQKRDERETKNRTRNDCRSKINYN